MSMPRRQSYGPNLIFMATINFGLLQGVPVKRKIDNPWDMKEKVRLAEMMYIKKPKRKVLIDTMREEFGRERNSVDCMSLRIFRNQTPVDGFERHQKISEKEDASRRYTNARTNKPWSDEEKGIIARLIFVEKVRWKDISARVQRLTGRTKQSVEKMIQQIKSGTTPVKGFEMHQ